MDFPKRTFSFHFFDIEEEENVNGETLTGKQKNVSPTYWFGKVLTKDQVATNEGKDSMLYSNMDTNNWERVVESCEGRVLPMNDNDVILRDKP